MINRLLALLYVLIGLAVAGFTLYSFSHGFMEPLMFYIAMFGCGIAIGVAILALITIWKQES